MEQELLDYDEEEATGEQGGANGAEAIATSDAKKGVKGSYVSIHSSGFRDFLLKPELLRAIVDCGFEHPSEGGCTHALPRRVHPRLALTSGRSLSLSLPRSARRVHSTGDTGHGRHLPGQERHGEDGRLRDRHAAADGGGGRAGLRARHVPHAVSPAHACTSPCSPCAATCGALSSGKQPSSSLSPFVPPPLGSWRSRSIKSTSASASTLTTSRRRCSLAG